MNGLQLAVSSQLERAPTRIHQTRNLLERDQLQPLIQEPALINLTEDTEDSKR